MRAYNFGVRKPMIIRDASYQDVVAAPEILIAELIDGDRAVIDVRSGHGDDGAAGDDDIYAPWSGVGDRGEEGEQECGEQASMHGGEP